MLDLFSEENIAATTAINNEFKESEPVKKIKNVYATKLDTIKRKDNEITDVGNVIAGAKKHNWKTMKFEISDLEGLELADIEKYLVKDRVIDLSEEKLKELGCPAKVCLIGPIINSMIPKKPNFSIHHSRVYSTKEKYYAKYIKTLKDIQSMVVNAKTDEEIKNLYNITRNIIYEKYNIVNAGQSYIANIISDISVLVRENPNSIGIDSVLLKHKDKLTPTNKLHKNLIHWLGNNANSDKLASKLREEFADEFEFGSLEMLCKANSKKYLSLAFNSSNKEYVERLMDAGYPDIPEDKEWMKKYKIQDYRVVATNETRYALVANDQFGNWKGNAYKEDGRTIISSTSLEEIQELARNEYNKEKPSMPKGAGRKSNKVEREVPKKRETFELEPTDKTYTEEHLLDKFKLWGIQFGNYQNNRQLILDNTVVALNALSDILRIKPDNISLGGNLGLAFGARGSSKALAHYESGGMVINLTKEGGAGSLAHEFGHALDHLVGKSILESLKIDSALNSNGGFLSNQTSYLLRVRKGEDHNIELESQRLMENVLKAMKYTDAGDSKTEFYNNALYYDKGTTKPYWATDVEMFARSFETFISDKLQEGGNKCHFLVSGIDNKDTTERSAYPCGVDRERINKALDKFLEHISINQDILMEPLKNVKDIRYSKYQIQEDREAFILNTSNSLVDAIKSQNQNNSEINNVLKNLSESMVKEIISKTVKELSGENINLEKGVNFEGLSNDISGDISKKLVEIQLIKSKLVEVHNLNDVDSKQVKKNNFDKSQEIDM